jgi:hypothetical protein
MDGQSLAGPSYGQPGGDVDERYYQRRCARRTWDAPFGECPARWCAERCQFLVGNPKGVDAWQGAAGVGKRSEEPKDPRTVTA